MASSTEATAAAAPPASTLSSSSSAASGSGSSGFGALVASHYNQLEEKGVQSRKQSRIYHMRNLNNWIKSQLVNEYVNKIREKQGREYRIRVLDMG